MDFVLFYETIHIFLTRTIMHMHFKGQGGLKIAADVWGSDNKKLVTPENLSFRFDKF